METILALHLRLSNTLWLFFLLLGLWGLFRAFRGQGVDSNYLGAMVIGQALYIIQGILGAVLWSGGLLSGLQRPSIHVLYGAFALVFLPFIYFVWLRGDDSNRAQWSLAFAILFLFGIALRAISTGV